MSGIQVEPTDRGPAQIGNAVGRHRAQARPCLPRGWTRVAWKRLAEVSPQVLDAIGVEARVVAGELRRSRDPNAVTDAHDPDFASAVGQRDHGGAIPGADRKGDRVTLDRIDWEADAERAKQAGAAVAESDDAGIRRHTALVGDDPDEPAIADVEGADRLCVAKLDVISRAVAGQLLREQMSIARLVVGVVDPAGDRPSLRCERGLELDASAGVENLVRQADLTQGPCDVPRARNRRLVAKQMEGAAMVGVVVDPGFLDQLVQLRLAVPAQAEDRVRVAKPRVRSALAQESDSPPQQSG